MSAGMDSGDETVSFDLDLCAAEPIHIPGAIQPHGVLLVLQGPALRIIQATSNCLDWLDKPLDALLEQPLRKALGAPLDQALRKALACEQAGHAQPVGFSWRGTPLTHAFTAYAHWVEGLVVLELEPVLPGSAARRVHLGQVLDNFARVRALNELPLKLQQAAEQIRTLTAYDRVMIYRFDADWHGEVIAEARRADLEPYLGLHYPASDIPAQARRLYTISPIRVIVDIDYEPVPLLPTRNPLSGVPLDMSHSVLRSVSPVHLQYLRNMGVRATLTASLTHGDHLWGLIACHHCTPRQVSRQMREAMTWLAQNLSTQIRLAEDDQARRAAAGFKQRRERVISALRHGARLADLLVGPELEDVLGAVDADGVALLRDAEVICGGQTPEPEAILSLVEQLATRIGPACTPLWVNNALGELVPEAVALTDTAAGVAMIQLSTPQSLRLIWFRGEHLRQVTWGGHPDKAVTVTPEGRLTPRQSFAAWTETVRGHSAPWSAEAQDSARELATLIDIEWRQLTEEALRQRDALIKDVLDSLAARIAVLDSRGVVTLINEAWRSFAIQDGGVPNGLIGINYLDICRRALRDPDRLSALAALQGIHRVMDGLEHDFSLEYRCDSPGNGPNWFEMHVFPLTGPSDGAVIVHMDITARKQAEDDIRRLNTDLEALVRERTAQLEAANKELEAFAYSVSHDLKAPLRGIDGYSRLLLNQTKLDEDSRVLAENVRQCVVKMTLLIDDLLAYSRMERRTLHCDLLDLQPLLAGIVADYAAEIERQGATVRLALPSTLQVCADLDGLRQALRNLLDNALKFGRAGVPVEVEMGGQAGAGVVTLWVKDNGIGIDPRFHERIFEIFQRLQRAEDYPGTGIGLAIVRKALQRMGGRVWVERAVDQGTAFFLELPAPGGER